MPDESVTPDDADDGMYGTVEYEGEEYRVQRDPDLASAERQLSFVTTGADDVMHVFSEEPSYTAWFIRHPAVEVTDVRIVDGAIVACTAEMPFSILTLKSKPRVTGRRGAPLSGGELRSE